MKHTLFQKLVQKARDTLPLSWRLKIAPIFNRLFYFFNITIKIHRKKPKVLSIDETIDRIIKEKLSVIRFGDGEISLMGGTTIGYQTYTEELAQRLKEIFRTDNPGLLICIPGIWDKMDLFTPTLHTFYLHHIQRDWYIWKELLSYTQVYGDTNMTRHYLGYKDHSHTGETFKRLFSIWEGQEVVIIEGEKSRLGVGNDLFAKTKSVQRLLCPAEDAYSKHELIKATAIEKIAKDKMILLSLGPAAKVLAYDLFKAGYRVLDVGHIDMEYEMFLRKETKLTKVKYKYFNEINERNPEDCDDPVYKSQILATISDTISNTKT